MPTGIAYLPKGLHSAKPTPRSWGPLRWVFAARFIPSRQHKVPPFPTATRSKNANLLPSVSLRFVSLILHKRINKFSFDRPPLDFTHQLRRTCRRRKEHPPHVCWLSLVQGPCRIVSTPLSLPLKSHSPCRSLYLRSTFL